jgi:hypothetical protein
MKSPTPDECASSMQVYVNRQFNETGEGAKIRQRAIPAA